MTTPTFEFRDPALAPIWDKVQAGKRLSFAEGEGPRFAHPLRDEAAVASQLDGVPIFGVVRDNPLLAAAVELRAHTIPHRVPHFNQPPNPRAGFHRHVIQWPENAVFVNAEPSIFVDAIGIGFDVIRRGNRRVKSIFGG